MGMVLLPVINDGEMPLPYLVQAIVEPDGKTIERLPNRRTFKKLMKPATAQQVREIMCER
jgi:cell division protein FtsI/penicillin-binding protein 2